MCVWMCVCTGGVPGEPMTLEMERRVRTSPKGRKVGPLTIGLTFLNSPVGHSHWPSMLIFSSSCTQSAMTVSIDVDERGFE